MYGGEYEKPITIEKAMENIAANKYLLPGIQRKFIWNTDQICVLFDSIMRDYPINTLMFWEVTAQEVKKDMRFYQFLRTYCERFDEDNKHHDIKGSDNDFFAVIDGQQRLTSLYIGLKGSYAKKLPRKHWPGYHDESILPSKKLYLNLVKPLEEDSNEQKMIYDFKFLTEQDAEKRNKTKQGKEFWFNVGNILNDARQTIAPATKELRSYLEKQKVCTEYSEDTLSKLYEVIRINSHIHFYKESEQALEKVLDMFIRTNAGGAPLKLADLLMSIVVANWKDDARKEINGFVNHICREYFAIERDFVLKTCLMLVDIDVKFKVSNFTAKNVKKIEEEWSGIRCCIEQVVKLIKSFGLDDKSLKAKNALIPIAYYLFHKDRDNTKGSKVLYEDINNKAKREEERRKIKEWLIKSLLKGVFGAQVDGYLIKVRKIIKSSLEEETFPLDKIVEEYKGTNKDIRFDDDSIEQILNTRKGETESVLILAILFAPLKFEFSKPYEIDHLHPRDSFQEKELDKYDFISKDEQTRDFYTKEENWDTIPNLQLLDKDLNNNKRKMPLEPWMKTKKQKREDMLIPKDADLSFEEFRGFIKSRRAFIKDKLRAILMVKQKIANI